MNTSILYTFFASFLIMLASLAGVVMVWKRLGHLAERNIKYLVSFAAGIFLIVSYNLLQESFELSSSLQVTITSFLAGILAAHLIAKLLPDPHHHHGSEEHQHLHDKSGAKRIMLSDAFHNIADGFLLAPAFVYDVQLGLITALGIWIHEITQEISEFFVLKDAGYKTRQALKLNFGVSSTILIGVIGGLALASTANFVGPILGIAGGAFVYTVLRDLLPRSTSDAKEKKNYIKHLLAGLIGVALISFVNYSTRETHVHTDGDVHHQYEHEVEHEHENAIEDEHKEHEEDEHEHEENEHHNDEH